MSYQVVLLKLLPKEYEADFLDGDLYLNTNGYFAAIDRNDAARFDPHEGIDESLQVRTVEIQDKDGSWLPLPVTGPMSTRTEATARSNILCMYMITDRPSDFFDSRNRAFGERAVIIANLLEFIARLKTAAKLAERSLHHGPIEYVERSEYHGRMGPFRKFNSHAHQNEYRFVLENGSGAPFGLKIGSIRDIAHTIATEQVAEYWEAMRNVPRADTSQETPSK
jgi:hypothetical protein